MADTPPPPRSGRLAVVVLLLATTVVIAGILLRTRPAPGPEPVEISPTPAPVADAQPIAFYLAQADAARGETYFTGRCGACHTIAPGGPHSIGPNLYGVIGQPLATRPGYNYSDALRAKGGRWDWESTNHFLQMPRAFVPGTRMTFGGVLRPQDRADVMLYLNGQGGTLTPPATAPVMTGAGPVAGGTRDFLIGSWGTDGCDPPAAIYAADGTTDGGRRRWALDGDRLIVTRGAEREQSVIERLGDDRMRLNTAAGPFELTRCPTQRR